ncbi:MAG: uroporphyrinogen decarboxylase family protein [Kiritimatiellae bacterium]|nr:uroporphyrinogen decarboxylase family protein [Kiritimatiellia bacterium]
MKHNVRKIMTPRERVLRALHGESMETVPFTIYEGMIPQCAAEREMRNRGLCIVYRKVPAVSGRHANTRMRREIFWENGKEFRRTFYETPKGTLNTLYENAGFTEWVHERMFKSPDDYPAILAYIQDTQYTPNYEAFARAEKDFGGDAILRPSIGLEPMQRLISGEIMDMQVFCIEWMDHRDEILKLYNAVAESNRKVYQLMADSPVQAVNYGGNVTPEITSPDMFRQYYMPHYAEAAEILHKKGKLIGCHLDANCRILSDLIAESPLDYIEAFTPAPGTDMSLAEARRAWPNKALWLNFPSAVHLKNDKAVEDFTVAMLDELPSTDGIIMGVTEDMPPDRWRDSCRAIMSGLDRQAGKRKG